MENQCLTVANLTLLAGTSRATWTKGISRTNCKTSKPLLHKFLQRVVLMSSSMEVYFKGPLKSFSNKSQM